MTSAGRYLSLIKFSHTIFAMPFALIGFFMATHFYGYGFSWILLLLVTLCMVFVRSAAMAFNRYADRRIDKLNPRTAGREIPSGMISEKAALMFTVLCCIAFMITCWFINRICFYLSPVALAVVLGYSYTKRFTALCHIVLGTGLALAPIGAWLAVTGSFSLIPLLFSFTVLTWVAGFDIIYALQDDDFDRQHKLFSIPARLGRSKALFLARTLHLISFIMVVLAGLFGGFGWFYWIGAGAFSGLLMYQHAIVSPADLSRVNIAFFSTNGIASMVFAVFVLADIFLSTGDAACLRP